LVEPSFNLRPHGSDNESRVIHINFHVLQYKYQLRLTSIFNWLCTYIQEQES
jgi:hypothetical protein